MDNVGYFLFSLDTELGTGRFDRDAVRKQMFSPDGSRERQSIFKLIELFERYQIAGTWAVVGHLFHNQCDDCAICPLMDWKGKYASFEEAYKTNNPLWYGADVIEALLTRGKRQEIAFHGYSHKIFDENLMTSQDAKIEIQEWLRVATGKGVVPHAVAFPRHAIGHLDAFKEAGFTCFRGEFKDHHGHKIDIRRSLKAISRVLALTTPPIFDLECRENHGLIDLPISQYFFNLNPRVDFFLDSIGLHTFRIRTIIKGIRKAAQEKKMIHIWAHPCEFKRESDFIKLRAIFSAVSEEVQMGRMRSVGMTEMAKIIIEKTPVFSK